MSAEALRQLEERVARLEEELKLVRAELNKESAQPWWKSFVGAGTDEASREVHEIIRRNREKDRERAIRRAEKAEAAEKARAKNALAKKGRPAKSKR
jgi:hypothetical protein